MQAAGGVDQHDIPSARLAGGNRVEDDRRGIRTGLRSNEIHSGARGPDLQLLDRGRTKRVGRANQRHLPRLFDEPRKLPDRRGLAGAVNADDEHDVRRLAIRGWMLSIAKNGKNLSLHEIAQRLPPRPSLTHRADDLIGRGDADVG